MFLARCFLVLMLAGGVFSAQARHGATPRTIAQIEAQNEIAAPTFSVQAHESARISGFLADALLLNNAQQHAVQAYTFARHKALLLAATPADVARAQHEYQAAVRRVLATSQFATYAALCQRLNGTTFSLDAVELAAR